jgi:hypothetical protein
MRRFDAALAERSLDSPLITGRPQMTATGRSESLRLDCQPLGRDRSSRPTVAVEVFEMV